MIKNRYDISAFSSGSVKKIRQPRSNPFVVLTYLTCTLCGSKRLRPCWTSLFEHSLRFHDVTYHLTNLNAFEQIMNSQKTPSISRRKTLIGFTNQFFAICSLQPTNDKMPPCHILKVIHEKQINRRSTGCPY